MKTDGTKNYYNDFSTWYERERHHGYHAMLDRLELDVILTHAQDKDVLEVGCGTGLIMNGIKDVAKSMVGIDISPGMLEEARKRGFTVTEGDAQQLPFDDESFDLAYSYKVLAHVPDIKKAMREMTRVLRPGGLLVAEFYNALSIRSIAKKLGRPGKISDNRTEAEVFTRWDTPRQIKSYLPPGLVFKQWKGVRVFTPTATIYNLPVMSSILGAAETWAVSSPLSRFGGFLIAICQKS